MTSLRATLCRLLLLALVLITSGCDWRPFEALRSQAPVQVLGDPGSLPAGELGSSLAQIVPPAPGTSGELVVLANGQPGFATFTFDGHGGSSVSTKEGASLNPPLGDPNATYGAIAPVASGQILVSVQVPPALVVVDPASFTTAKSVTVPLTKAAPENDFGNSLAAADLDGDGKQEWAVTSDETLTVYFDEAASGPVQCALPATADLSSHVHGLVAGDLAGGGRSADLLVGVPGDPAGASVWILRASDLGKSGAGCATVWQTLRAPDGASDKTFGAAIALGHIHAATSLDLLVGAPGENAVFVYYNDGSGRFPSRPDERLAPSDPTGAVAFGSALEALPLESGAIAALDGGKVDGSKIDGGARDGAAGDSARSDGLLADVRPLDGKRIADVTLADAMPGDAPSKVDGGARDASRPSEAMRPDAMSGVDAGPVPPALGPDDVVVGDPLATIGGDQNAGRIHVFRGSSERVVLYDRNPSIGAQLGLTLGRLDFVPAAGGSAVPLLVAGGHSAIYVYFNAGLPGERDPRQ